MQSQETEKIETQEEEKIAAHIQAPEINYETLNSLVKHASFSSAGSLQRLIGLAVTRRVAGVVECLSHYLPPHEALPESLHAQITLWFLDLCGRVALPASSLDSVGADVLLKSGLVRVDATSEGCLSALKYACKRGHLECVRLLLEHKADAYSTQAGEIQTLS